MAATVTGSKTVLNNISPNLSAAVLTTLLATAPENLTVGQLKQLRDALSRIPGGGTPASTLGSLLL